LTFLLAGFAASVTATFKPLDTCKINLAIQQTSWFENDSPVLQYGYCEDIGDGNGYTVGFAGLCSGTSDLYSFLYGFTHKHPNTCFQKSMSTLSKLNNLANNGDYAGSISALKSQNFCGCWHNMVKLAYVREAYYAFVQSAYFEPSQALAKKHGVTLALSLAQFYDAYIQHGPGYYNDEDSINALVYKTEKKYGLAKPDNQYHWLVGFLEIRRQDLINPRDHSAKETWGNSTYRIDSFEYTINRTQNFAFTSPLYGLGANWEPTVTYCAGDPHAAGTHSSLPPKLRTTVRYHLDYPNSHSTRAPGLKDGVNWSNNVGIVVP